MSELLIADSNVKVFLRSVEMDGIFFGNEIFAIDNL